jgi:hypothetical protein
VIDVWGVLANGLWVVGLATLLAGFSWAYWISQTEQVRLRRVLGRPRVDRRLSLGLLLLCAGLATTGRAWWERVLWTVLAAAWLLRAWWIGRGNQDLYGDGSHDSVDGK